MGRRTELKALRRPILIGAVLAAVLAVCVAGLIAYAALDHNPMGEYCALGAEENCSVRAMSVLGFLSFLVTSPHIDWQNLGPLLGGWFFAGFAFFLTVFLGLVLVARLALSIFSRRTGR